jgi:hypothetical protein
MSTEQKGEKLNEPVFSRTGKLLNRPLPEGDLLKTEAPTGNKLWKKKKKLNEENGKNITLNE